MATDATGSPTPLGIPKFNTSADAPSGLGSNAQMDSIDTLIAARVAKPSGIVSGEAAIWNGTGWDRSSVTKLTASNIANGITFSQLSGYPSDSTKFARGDGTWAAPVGAYSLISDQVLSSSAVTLDISSIPSTYKHLQLFLKLRSDKSGVASGSANIKINNDSSAIYDYEYGQFVGATTSGAGALGDTRIYLGDCPAATAGANKFSTTKIDIIDYSNTTEHKTMIAMSQNIFNTSAPNFQMWQTGGLWRSTAAINRLTVFEFSGANWIANSRMTLYGLG